MNLTKTCPIGILISVINLYRTLRKYVDHFCPFRRLSENDILVFKVVEQSTLENQYLAIFGQTLLALHTRIHPLGIVLGVHQTEAPTSLRAYTTRGKCILHSQRSTKKSSRYLKKNKYSIILKVIFTIHKILFFVIIIDHK